LGWRFGCWFQGWGRIELWRRIEPFVPEEGLELLNV
jgi:hypothetical protein